MIISVGSSNPNKISAVERVVKKLLDNSKIVSVNSPSLVRNMPLNDDEAITGAMNRAKHSLEQCQADYGVGIEGGVHETSHGMFLNAWAAVINKQGKVGLGCTSRILLPEVVANEIRKGRELGPVMDKLTGKKDVKKHEGTSGLLTKGMVKRSESFEQAIINAFMKFLNNKFYEGEKS